MLDTANDTVLTQSTIQAESAPEAARIGTPPLFPMPSMTIPALVRTPLIQPTLHPSQLLMVRTPRCLNQAVHKYDHQISHPGFPPVPAPRSPSACAGASEAPEAVEGAVSYTHLTLPTICSV
eukprot:6888847-Alexandrium_andersonii.AAC.2